VRGRSHDFSFCRSMSICTAFEGTWARFSPRLSTLYSATADVLEHLHVADSPVLPCQWRARVIRVCQDARVTVVLLTLARSAADSMVWGGAFWEKSH
jgi:hypothetical protein